MYIPKGTTISYRIVNVRCEGIEKEMVLVDKDVFENIVTKLGFEKKEEKEDKEEQKHEEKEQEEQKQEQIRG
jgi:hypothetical protein